MIQQRAVDSIKKKVFIDFYTNWCGWCKRMDVSTFSDPVIVNYIKNNFGYFVEYIQVYNTCCKNTNFTDYL